jgi:glucuronate isomerase
MLNKKSAPHDKVFITEDFLLQSKAAKILYNEYAKDLPIIDYHNHLPTQEIAENKKFKNITELWLYGDHYKWRAMRAWGMNEKLITGDADDKEKFFAWAEVAPKTVRNPLFHWTQLELKNSFGIDNYLNVETVDEIYSTCNGLLHLDSFSTQSLLTKFKVEFVGTTDDPCDNLIYHRQLAKQKTGIAVKPSFRPDKIFQIANRTNFISYLRKLEQSNNKVITDIATLLEALQNRVDFFHENGCRISDHGFSQMPGSVQFTSALETEFKQFLTTKNAVFSNPEALVGYILLQLCKMYHAKSWVQQFHLGSIRNNNSRLLKLLGTDCGADSIGDLPQANALASFLDALDNEDKLAKTIIYNNNPADNEVFATMVGNFNDGVNRGKIQFGSGWWYLDQKDGMEK